MTHIEICEADQPQVLVALFWTDLEYKQSRVFVVVAVQVGFGMGQVFLHGEMSKFYSITISSSPDEATTPPQYVIFCDLAARV